jgi:hypothetical protein
MVIPYIYLTCWCMKSMFMSANTYQDWGPTGHVNPLVIVKIIIS